MLEAQKMDIRYTRPSMNPRPLYVSDMRYLDPEVNCRSIYSSVANK